MEARVYGFEWRLPSIATADQFYNWLIGESGKLVQGSSPRRRLFAADHGEYIVGLVRRAALNACSGIRSVAGIARGRP